MQSLNIPVTRTKIVVPRRRAELLSRPRLLELLDRVSDYKLVIVTAPAGYGKTSLLIDFAHRTELPICWLSLDAGDQDPQRFLTHLIAAINHRFHRFGRNCMEAIQSMPQDQFNLNTAISLVINDLVDHIAEHFVIVLDDFHLVEPSKDVVEFVNRFVQEMDENCHIAAASRTLLALPDMPLLVARSQVSGLSFQELSFLPAEIQELLRTNFNMDVPAKTAEQLVEDTEGWITGLLLSSQSPSGEIAERLRLARVSGVDLYDYLAQQVFEQQEPRIRDFLLRTSLLEEFNARLCEQTINKALKIDVDWQELMSTALQKNLFLLPVGDEGEYLRYHHLFRDFLQRKIGAERIDETKAIQTQMVDYLCQKAKWEDAIELQQKLGGQTKIIDLIITAGSDLISQGRFLTLSKWIDDLPQRLVKNNPALLSLRGGISLSMGFVNDGITLLSRAVDMLRRNDPDGLLNRTLLRRATSYRLLGNIQLAQNDIDDASRKVSSTDGNQLIQADLDLEQAEIYYGQGRLADAILFFDHAIHRYRILNETEANAKAEFRIASAYKSAGRLNDAAKCYQSALEYFRKTHNISWQASLLNNLGGLQHLLGDYEQAVGSFEKSIEYSRLGGIPFLEAYALSSMGDAYLDLNALEEAEEAYRQARVIALKTDDKVLLYYIELSESELNRLYGRMDSAISFHLQAEKRAQESRSEMQQIGCDYQFALNEMSLKNYDNAVSSLSKILAFYSHSGHRIEEIRTRVIYALVLYELGQKSKLLKQIKMLEEVKSIGEYKNIILATGNKFKNIIERVMEYENRETPIAQFAQEITKHNERINYQRKTIRRQLVIVPFAPAKIIIRTLGKIQVKVSGRILTTRDWMTQSVRDFFLLIVSHPEGVTKEAIGEILWPNSTANELRLRFKNSIYRVRRALGSDVILFENDTYFFNKDLDYEFDVELFLDLIKKLDASQDLEQKMTQIRNVLRVYKGIFLPEISSPWVATEREFLHKKHHSVLIEAARVSFELGYYDQAISFSQRVIASDQLDENAYRMAMRSYAAIGNQAGIVKEYERCRRAINDELGTPPSQQTRQLYELLITK